MFKYENDSRKVTKGQTFVAIKGLTVDGHDYIDKAIANGASEIICEKDLDIVISTQPGSYLLNSSNVCLSKSFLSTKKNT